MLPLATFFVPGLYLFAVAETRVLDVETCSRDQ